MGEWHDDVDCRPEGALRPGGRGGQDLLLVRLRPLGQPAVLRRLAQGGRPRAHAVRGPEERDRLSLRLQAVEERPLLRRDPPEPVSGRPEPLATGLNRNSEPFLVLRNRAQRGVSKDDPVGADGCGDWTILRDAMLRTAPQDEGVRPAPNEGDGAAANFFLAFKGP